MFSRRRPPGLGRLPPDAPPSRTKRVRNWQAQPTDTPIACAVCCSDKPNSKGNTTACACLSSSTVFAFAKQAFCNYYFMVVGALCCATAALTPARGWKVT